MRTLISSLLVAVLASCATAQSEPSPPSLPSVAAIDAAAARAMAATGARGLAIAVIDDGEVVATRAYGERNAAGAPLEEHSIMYGASLTKAAFAYFVMQLVDEGRIDLDTSIAEYLPRPLPDHSDDAIADRYARWSDLAGDERWRLITPRILLTHSPGFHNFGFLEEDGRLRIHFTPGERYSYSGDGLILLQFVIEQGLGLDIEAEMKRRMFDRFGLVDTSLEWRDDYAGRTADGWTETGEAVEHDVRSQPRAAGSMDTSIHDMGLLVAAMVRGEALSAEARSEITQPQLPIRTASQFPILRPDAPPEAQHPTLAAGLGVVVFDGPQGRGFYKGGHNEITGNTMVCVQRSRRCVVILANDVRAEAAFPYLVRTILGETGTPWRWEYGDKTFYDGPDAR